MNYTIRNNVSVLACALLALSTLAWADFREQVEADWVLQEQMRVAQTAKVTPESDAIGGCDGLKDGKWGFHTAVEKDPWWQVDLGETRPVARVVLWNRCDAAERLTNFTLSLSDDGTTWRTAYTHDGTVFRGVTDGKPLTISLDGQRGRFVRVQQPGGTYLHLDEAEVFGTEALELNLALGRPALQSSVSQWSVDHRAAPSLEWLPLAKTSLERCGKLAAERREEGMDVSREAAAIEDVQGRLERTARDEDAKPLFIEARWIQRGLALSNPLLDFETILFVKRVPGSYSHMSDQYYGWWSRPGGGIYLLRGFRENAPALQCLTDTFTSAGSFLRPAISHAEAKVLFAWCRYYPSLAGEQDKLNKANVPEDAFYHVFEMNADGTGARQLTRGKYDDFDARYLPDGRIVFLSTRRGQALQCTLDTARESLDTPDLPDCYVRCGGGPPRPVAVYTLHTMDRDGAGLTPISPFEMFEWTPSVARDGTILYSRWDYIDRSNMPYMSLWSMHPDGTHPRIVYKNYTTVPHCTFEPQSVPGSNKIVFTGSAHHAQTMGSLVLLDPSAGTEGAGPMKRLTPEVCFPEIEGWPRSYYANPWPLSERFYLVSWGCVKEVREGNQLPANGMGLYLFDAEGGMELLYRDPEIGSECPIPVRPEAPKPVLAAQTQWDGASEGRFVLTDVYRGLKTAQRGEIKALRIVAVPPKTHPVMNFPNLGITADDPGKCVLGTVPVEADGSAHFRVPAGVIVFFQALDAKGMAVQTMRGATNVQPGQTLSCAGCHEPRSSAPAMKPVQAMRRAPSKIAIGPEGSWPLRFDKLVQPVLDKYCVRCHSPQGEKPGLDLSTEKAWKTLLTYGQPSLEQYVRGQYAQGFSTEGACAARTSPVLAKILAPGGHHGVELDTTSVERLITWMDTYGQQLGSFGEEQERRLEEDKARWAPMLVTRGTDATEGMIRF